MHVTVSIFPHQTTLGASKNAHVTTHVPFGRFLPLLGKGLVVTMARYLLPLLTRGVGGDGHGHIPHLSLRGKGSGGGVPFLFWEREGL